MNKKTAIIIAAVVVVLAGAGVGIALALNNQMKDDNTTSDTNKQENKVDTATTFKPQDPTKLSYVATSTAKVGEQSVTSTIESDGKGVQKSTSEAAGMKTESYMTTDFVITCMNGSCTKTAIDKNAATTDSAAIDTSKFSSSAKNAGTETINGKNYQVWKVTVEEFGEITYYLDSENRIGRVVMGTTSTVDYEYKPVTITLPQV